ncbi:aspartate/glutamate racemase family protein [Mucilaginibacter lappiensis]|uniref:Aspartate racemase n=1 Tax=Mucilaginibacter lappiensis TaxID=354630 RepID=A0A841JVM0_9SPHI|nr:amino acid racemase [Mucilaginibacter lappiensis]MBB6131861.1 aspartate racemase [Mucilaginibacter lappiensis]
MFYKKKLGVIGGMGSRAGIYLLQKIIDYSPAETDQDFPEIIFHNNSEIPDRTKAILLGQQSPLTGLLKSVALFNQNQIDIIILGCITSYYYYDQLSAATKANVLNPIQLVLDQIKAEYRTTKRIGLLATTGTIESKLFHNNFSKQGIEVVTLHPFDQENVFMKAVYMKNGFKSSIISSEAKSLMLESARLISDMNVDVVIGGCTEVSLGIQLNSTGVPYLDALDILARNTVKYCYQTI